MSTIIFSKKKAPIILWFASLLFSSTSCSAFFDSGYTISDIKKTEDENGNTLLEIVFDDDNIEPIKVSINNGVGIDNVSSTLKDGKLYLTISYTDNREDTVLEIPVLEGEKGVSVVDINTTTDDDGNIKIVFVFSDGTQSNEIIIPKGNNGVGIQNISCTLDENTNIYKLVFTLSDGSEIGPFFINNGTDGKEIVSVNTSETENNYILEIVYSDGTSSPVVLSKPTSNRWYYGSTVPEEDLGKEGDFYFYVTDKCIYTKTALGRNLLISLDGHEEDKYYNVTFNVNGGKWKFVDSSSEKTDELRTFSFKENSYVNLDEEILQVYREGYEFDGWWSDPIITVNSGKFTKLTPISNELTLYAKWNEVI